MGWIPSESRWETECTPRSVHGSGHIWEQRQGTIWQRWLATSLTSLDNVLI